MQLQGVHTEYRGGVLSTAYEWLGASHLGGYTLSAPFTRPVR